MDSQGGEETLNINRHDNHVLRDEGTREQELTRKKTAKSGVGVPYHCNPATKKGQGSKYSLLLGQEKVENWSSLVHFFENRKVGHLGGGGKLTSSGCKKQQSEHPRRGRILLIALTGIASQKKS